MKQQIQQFSIHQTAKVLAFVYGLLGMAFVPLVWLGDRLDPEGGGGMGMGLLIVFPVLYAVAGYVTTAIGCAIYNEVASRVGGIEFISVPVESGGSD